MQSSLLSNKEVISSSILPKITFDHNTILLHIEDEEDLGPIPFHFIPLWKVSDGFLSTVKMAWDLLVVGSSNFVWEKKLVNTKTTLKDWVKHSKKNPISERREALQKLEKIQLEMEETEIAPALLEKEKKTQFNSFQAFKREQEYWRLKSRSTWLKAGDRNTSFFHKQCRTRISKNNISKISSKSGEMVKGFSQIKQLAKAHFQKLYREEFSSN